MLTRQMLVMVISLGAGHQWKVEVISQQIGEEK
ncbi:hypothetical protein QG37_05829 [Candidozyma auris]|uniref:Uncharacterized protein n=1 Tax=Candidozyma auris TaxID=498019 RepID=A0A0L0NTF6_CANAR|nr:hypothetical protein QG37_05829 [[Candida] auris]